MALTVGDIVQLDSVQIYLEQELRNVFHFRCTSVSGSVSEEEIAQAFDDSLGVAIRQIQLDTVFHALVQYQNLTNDIDFTQLAVSEVGERSGDPTPSYLTASYTLTRSTKVTRNGGKRIGGIPEADTAGNIFASNGAAQREALRLALFNGFTVPQTGTIEAEFEPVIVGTAVGGGLDLSKINIVKGALGPKLSTQNTRKQKQFTGS